MKTRENQITHDQLQKPYVKPRIERVKLVPQETVLGGCKAENITHPGADDCDNPLVATCRIEGS